MAVRDLVMTEAYIEGAVGQQIWSHQKHEVRWAIFHLDTGKRMENIHLIKDSATSATWTQSEVNEFV